MTINQLRYFLQICEFGNISTAAQALFISHQALSKSLTALEAEVGVPLFYRTQGGLVLTDTGTFFRDNARGVVEHFDSFATALNESISQRSLTLKVGIFEEGLHIFTPEDIDRFHAQYPQYALEIQEYPFKVCNQLLMAGEKDAVMTLEAPQDKEITTIPLKVYERILIVPKSHPLAKRDTIYVEDLKDLHFVLSMNQRDLEAFYLLCRQSKFEPHVVQIVPQISNMFELCERYGYVGLCSDFSTAKLIPRYKKLVQKHFSGNPLPFPTMLSFHSSRKNSKALKALIEFLQTV